MDADNYEDRGVGMRSHYRDYHLLKHICPRRRRRHHHSTSSNNDNNNSNNNNNNNNNNGNNKSKRENRNTGSSNNNNIITSVLILYIIFYLKFLQALDELADFMFVNGEPNKDRQKLLRNFKVRTTGVDDDLQNAGSCDRK